MKKLFAHASKRHKAAGLTLFILDGLFFTMTNPNKVPSAMLIVGFVLVALSTYGLLRLCLAMLAFYGVPLKHKGRRIALLVGISCAISLALQSLGELTMRDVVVLTLLSGLAYIYMTYGRGRN